MTSQPAPKSARPVDDDEPVDNNDVGDPKKIGKYEIVRKLGQGGMGAVFLARDAALRRDVALKVLPKDKAENPTLVRRFQAEAQAAAKLRHDNIVAVYDSDMADGYCYIAMEFVDGKDLHEMVSRRGPVPVKRSIEIIKQVALALQHAFEHNIVHRDIKPSNLLVRRDGVVKLTDLGLARSVDDSIETGITRAGTTVGTVDYMAPEQGRSSKAADIRSDLYSLGCTWYFMLTGQPPFPDGSLTNKLQAHAIKAPPDPRALNENVADGLVAVIHQMLAKKPEARYQTPKELLDDLNTAALTRNAISAEIFDEPVVEAPVRSRPLKKETLPNDEMPLDAPSRPSRSSKKPQQQEDDAPIDVPSRPRSSTKKPFIEEEYEEPAEPSSRKKSAAKNPDVDIYTEVSDEVPVRRHRAASTEHVESDRTESVGTSSSSGKSKPREAGVLPPPSRRSPDEIPSEEPAGINLEWMKVVGAVAGILVVVGGLGYLVSSYSGQIFGFGPPPVRPLPVPVGQGKGAPTVELAPVGGVAGSDKPMFDGSTPVAQIYSAGTKTDSEGNPLPRNAANAPTGTGADGNPQSNPNIALIPEGTGTAVSIDPEKFPDWPASPAPKYNTVYTIGPGTTSGVHFNALSEALVRVPPEGAQIQLLGNGPFVLSTPASVTTRRLLISAEPNTRPVVVLGTAGEGLVGSLKVTGGQLELNGIHLTVDRSAIKGTDPVKALAVNEGALLLRDSTMTVSGTSAAPFIMLALEGVAPAGTRLLIDKSFLRGDPTVAVDVRCSMLDGVVRDSVIACGSGTVFRLASTSTGSKGAPRILRSIHSTWCSPQVVFDLSGDAELETPPPTHIVMTESVCATGSDPGSRLLLSADGWLQDPLRQSLVWTSKSSAYLGFDNLLDLGAKSAFRARNADDWRRFWQQKVDVEQFSSDPWPTGLVKMATVSALEFDRDHLPGGVQKLARKDETIGTATAKLLVPETTHPLRLAALSMRRPLPNEAVQSAPLGKARRIDLKKEDLGVILSRADWANGTVFEAVGFGNCPMAPVQLKGRQLRIVFRQGDGAPLKLIPRDAGKDVEALFRLERSTLEIEDLRYQPPESRPTLPAWFLSAVDSQVILRRCEFIGPEKLAAPYQGAVKFTTAVAAASQPPTLSIVQCLMQSPGTMIRVEGGAAAVFVRNSVLASRGTLLDLRPAAIQDALPVSVDIVQSTLSTTETIFHQTAATLSQPMATTGVNYFVENCAFGPPFSIRPGDATGATLMTLSGPVRDQQQLVWWGQANGVSREVRTLLKSVNPDAPPVTDAAAWSALWGEGHDLNFLASADGVMPHEPLPVKRENLKASSYTLHPVSKGTTWADGRSIGADTKSLEGLGPQKVAPEPAANTKKATVPTPKPNPGGASKTGGF